MVPLLSADLVLSSVVADSETHSMHDGHAAVAVHAGGQLTVQSKKQTCDGYVTCDLDFNEKNVKTGPAGLPMTISKVCSVNGTALDLQVSNLTMYTPAAAQNTKVKGKIGQLDVKIGTGVLVRFQLLEHNTTHPLEVDSLYFSLVPGEVHPDHGEEWVKTTLTGFNKYKLNAVTDITHAEKNSSVVFKSTRSARTSFTPTDLMALTDEQKKLAVALEFKKVSHWDVEFQVGSSSSFGHNFSFGGASSLLYPCPQLGAPASKRVCSHYAGRASHCSCC